MRNECTLKIFSESALQSVPDFFFLRMDGYTSGWFPGQTRAGPEMDSTRERKLGGEGKGKGGELPNPNPKWYGGGTKGVRSSGGW